MPSKERRETDAIATPININRIIPKVRPWTDEEAEKARIANKFLSPRSFRSKDTDRYVCDYPVGLLHV